MSAVTSLPSAAAIFRRAQTLRKQRAKTMPDEERALITLFDAYERLKEFGFNDAIYCPKDGTVFGVVEAGSTGIHRCHYDTDWPKGGWWVHDGGDLWPARPILFRLITPKEQETKCNP